VSARVAEALRVEGYTVELAIEREPVPEPYQRIVVPCRDDEVPNFITIKWPKSPHMYE
jgi:hypothetical protein